MLDLRKLRHLTVLAQRLNYVRAADELGITQPTLTRSIQALERQLQVKLFDRDHGSVNLTPQGRSIVERAGFLLTDAEDLEHHSRLYGQGQGGRVSFGMAPMPARALLAPVLSERLILAPQVTNEVAVRDVEALWGMLVAGEIEFFVSPNPPLHDLSHAIVDILGLFPLSILVRAGHPLLGETAKTQQQYPLLRSSWTGMSLPDEMRPRILGRPNLIEDFATLAEITSSTDAMWLSSAYAMQDKIADGSLVELFRASQHIEVTLYSLKRRSKSPLAEGIGAALRQQVLSLCSSLG